MMRLGCLIRLPKNILDCSGCRGIFRGSQRLRYLQSKYSIELARSVTQKTNFFYYNFGVQLLEVIDMAKWGEGDPRWIVEERPDATNVNNWHWYVLHLQVLVLY